MSDELSVISNQSIGKQAVDKKNNIFLGARQMKRISFLFLIMIFQSSLLCAEKITLVTYYPGPQGAFEELYLRPQVTVLPSSCEIGTVYFNPDGRFVLCEEDENGNAYWQPGSLWEKQGNSVYLTDTADVNPDLFVGIGTTTPEFKLTLENDGGLLAKGTFGLGVELTTAGAGTRLIWYPKKAAFRAGHVNGSTWDNINIAAYSTAFNYQTKASGFASTALGSTSLAQGDYSTAAGTLSRAEGNHSTTIGLSAIATGAFATALGRGAIASGNYATSLGANPTAQGANATAIGQQAKATGIMSTAMGKEAFASDSYATAIGNTANAQAEASTAMGSLTVASGVGSTAMGTQSTASGNCALALGFNTTASGDFSLSMGLSTTAATGYHSVAIGRNANARGDYSGAIGLDTIASAYNSFVAGAYNRDSTAHNLTAWRNDEPLFIIGNGTATTNRKNAVMILKNGNVGIGSDNPQTVLNVQGLEEHADNTAAMAAGLTPGAVYRSGDILKIVH